MGLKRKGAGGGGGNLVHRVTGRCQQRFQKSLVSGSKESEDGRGARICRGTTRGDARFAGKVEGCCRAHLSPRHRGFRKLHAPPYSGSSEVPEKHDGAGRALTGRPPGRSGGLGLGKRFVLWLVLALAGAQERRWAGLARASWGSAGAAPPPARGEGAGASQCLQSSLGTPQPRRPAETQRLAGCGSNWGAGKGKARGLGQASA